MKKRAKLSHLLFSLGFGLSLGLGASASALADQTTPVPDVRPNNNGWYAVINVPQQRMFLYENGELYKVYPVGVGKAMTQTNLGEHKIGGKAFNPVWHIPKSIQKERGDGVKSVPPGPNNPLGPVFVRMGDPKLGLGIHGTNNPSSVPGVVSHGCVRMKPEQALEFANTITTGSYAHVTHETAALNVDDADNLWLAVYKDWYSQNNLNINALKTTIQNWAKANNAKISMKLVDSILKNRNGKVNCLSCKTKAPKIKGDLKSLAWNQSSIELTSAKNMSVRPNRNNQPTQNMIDEDLENNEIEVDVDGGSDDMPIPVKKPIKSKSNQTKSKINNNINDIKPEAASQPQSQFKERILTPLNTSVFDEMNPEAASTPNKYLKR